MKKFLIAGSSLATVAAAGSAGAVDVTLGGSIDMGIEFGVGKASSFSFSDAYNSVSLSLAVAGTTDGGMKYGGSFSLATAAELEVSAYMDDDDVKHLVKMTNAGGTDIKGAAYAVSGGKMISPDAIVGVKINSDWNSVGGTISTALLGLNPGMDASAICKVAGRHDRAEAETAKGAVTPLEVMRTIGLDDEGEPITSKAEIELNTLDDKGGHFGNDAYLPAGKLLPAISGRLWLTVSAEALTPKGEKVQDQIALRNGSDEDGWDVGVNDPDARDAFAVEAEVYVGPFMEVKLQSSSTKMVIGAVCVDGMVESDANYFLNNVSKVVTASDASIYIEGGFGKLTLQTGDYAGGVSAIGDAGDAADISADGLVAIVEGVGLLGANPFVAVDLAPGRALDANLEILTGGTIDLGGLSAAVDIKLGTDTAEAEDANSAAFTSISAWDLGLDYAMGDMGLSFAYDSGNDWGMTASMDLAGFGVGATVYNNNADAHEKSGLFYSVSASTSLNGFGLSIGVDQDMKPTVNLSKSMGGLSMYAGYDAADNGGKVGATLSF